MANTSELKDKVERWYREKLQERFPGYSITQEKVQLIWNGSFEYDAVVKLGEEILEVRCLSCSEYKTKSGNGGSGKLQKIKADALMMIGTNCIRKVLSFTGKTMYSKMLEEQKNGRFPTSIMLEYLNIENEREISEIVDAIYNDASAEMNSEI